MRTLILCALLCACGGNVEVVDPLVIDGDTFAASGDRYRLARIDAPEMPGHCRPGRDCVEGDPYLARDHLADVLSRGPVSCEEIERDHYGRAIVECWAGHTNVSDAMLRSGLVEKYERRRR